VIAAAAQDRVVPRVASPWATALDGVISIFVGTAFTMALFSLVAHVDQARTNPAAPVIEDLRVASLPVEIPPPPVTQTETEPVTEMITGIDVAAAESPVQISLSVPILESPPVPQAPAARIQTTVVPSEFKPRMDLTQEFDHIFQQTEVDQKPTVLANSAPFIPINVHRGVRWLRVVLLMVIDARGVASNIRVLTSSGNAEFDSLIVECVHDKWEFSPAIKKGRKVKCLVQRSVTIRWDSSPFES
jgi:TonB family protein